MKYFTLLKEWSDIFSIFPKKILSIISLPIIVLIIVYVSSRKLNQFSVYINILDIIQNISLSFGEMELWELLKVVVFVAIIFGIIIAILWRLLIGDDVRFSCFSSNLSSPKIKPKKIKTWKFKKY